ncbi:putative protein phosphatase 2C 43, partial [Bienertia sinuspersici]
SGVIRSLFRTIWDFIKPVLRCFKGNDHHDTWSVELKNHFLGQFSMAVCQANENIEDRSQVEIGENATFVGIYDGHGGQEAADYVLNHLFNHLIEHIVDTKVMTENAIRHAIAATEHGFIEAARNAVQTNPHMALEGCCCVIGIIYRSRLFVANVGDSRAVLGYTLPDSAVFMMHAEPLTVVHNVNVEHIKKELLDAHPSEPELVVANDDGVHLIKNRIQVTRSIGDLYLKYPEFAIPDVPIRRGLLTARPTRTTRQLRECDKFLIFASSGLWKHFSNDGAVDFVLNHPRKGIARRLVEEARKRAAETAGVTYEEVKRAPVGGLRRRVHDDITVVVVFIDYQLLYEGRPERLWPIVAIFNTDATKSENKGGECYEVMWNNNSTEHFNMWYRMKEKSLNNGRMKIQTEEDISRWIDEKDNNDIVILYVIADNPPPYSPRS